MKKKSTLIALALSLAFTFVAVSVPAKAADNQNETTFTVKASKEKVKPGDTITYKVSMDEVENLGSIRFKVSLPKGLSLVKGSSETKDVLGNESTTFNENSLIYMAGGFSEGYDAEDDTLLLSFQCKADKKCRGDKTVDLVIDPEDIFEFAEDGDAPSVLIPYTVENVTVHFPGEAVPKTGDNNNLMVWSSVMALLLLGAAGMIYMKKRQYN